MGVRFLGIGREAARSDNRRRDFNDDRTKQLADYNDVLGLLRSRSGDADRRSGMSVRDLFGDSIDRRTDAIRQNANDTKRNISRLGVARGADPTGATNVAFNQVDQGSNQNISNVMDYFTNLGQREKDQEERRGDQLLNLVLGGRGNLLNLANRNYQNEITRNLQRKQANKQLGADIFGTLVGAGTQVATAGAG